MRFRLFVALAAFACGVDLRAQSANDATKPPARPKAVEQTVTVTANRGLVGLEDASASIATLPQTQLTQAPGLALDDRLHQVAGFQLFRRTSSWTANPTSQGVSLRGLGSTAASRTLVVSDQVPLNDPFGGWIHWNETSALAIAGVSLVRGGSANLYGSSAIGGVIDVEPVSLSLRDRGVMAPASAGRVPPAPAVVRFAADASGATENSALGDGLLTADTRYLLGLGALTVLSTGGYIPTAPASRGPVDVPSNVTAESARLELRTPAFASGDTAFLRGNVLNEARSNGTSLTTNGTRLWRYQAGAEAVRHLTTYSVRAFGSRETYRQSFSSVTSTAAAPRSAETLTSLQRVPTDEFGFALQAARQFHSSVTAALGLDLRDVRATDDETRVVTGVTTSTSARQRELGGFAVANWRPDFEHRAWSFSGSVRADSFRTLDALQVVSNAPTHTKLPEIDELFASPRLGLSRRLGGASGLTATAFRAFRGPTMNELYRTGQIAAQTTLANSSLLAERATGFELGGYAHIAHFATVRPTYFWTEVNRPISAVLLSQSGAAQTLQRQNLGQIRSRGLMVEASSDRWHGFDATASYQFAVATVTSFNSSSPAQHSLTGKWIPQVPRQSVTMTANYAAPHIASFHAFGSYTGQQFDDSDNQQLLHPYARFDVSAERSLRHGFIVFASVQNLLNRSIDAGRTPLLTLAAPRLVQAGVRFSLSH